jgi:dTDP-4-amino-4,6-dideoxygalactose transaminase
LPNTQRVADRVVVLPTGTAMDTEIIDTVTAAIRVLVNDRP